MADETIKKILDFEVKLNDADAKILSTARAIEDAEKELKLFNETRKLNIKLTDEQILQEAELKVKLQANKEEYRALTNIQKQKALADKAEIGSIDQLNKLYKAAESELKRLGGQYTRNKDGSIQLTNAHANERAEVKQLFEQLKAYDAGLSNHRLNVGNYTNSITGLETQLAALRDEIKTLDLGSKEFTETKKKIDDVSFSLQVATGKIDELGNREARNKLKEGFSDAQQSIGAMTQSLTLLTVAFKDNENASAVVNKVLQGLAVTQTALVVIQAKKSVQDTADIVLTKARTAAQWALNNATQAFTLIGVVAIVTTLVALYNKMRASITGVTEEQRKANEVYTNEKIKLDALLNTARDSNESLETRHQAIKDINEIAPEYLGNIRLETINTKETTAAINEYLTAIKNKAYAEAVYDKLVEKSRELADAQDRLAKGATLGDIIKQGITGQISIKAVNDVQKLRTEIDELSKTYSAAMSNVEATKKVVDNTTKSFKDLNKENSEFIINNINAVSESVKQAQQALEDLGIDTASNFFTKLTPTDEEVKRLKSWQEQYDSTSNNVVDNLNRMREAQDERSREEQKNDEAALKSLEDLKLSTEDYISITESGLDIIKSLSILVGSEGERAAQFQKTLAVFQLAIDTAKAVSGAISGAQTVPFPGNLLAMATSLASVFKALATAKQLLTADAPKYYEGGEVDVAGDKNVKDGTVWQNQYGQRIKTHAGEKMFVLNPSASDEYRKLSWLSSFNQAFGGRGMKGSYNSLYDGGIANTNVINKMGAGFDYNKFAEAIMRNGSPKLIFKDFDIAYKNYRNSEGLVKL